MKRLLVILLALGYGCVVEAGLFITVDGVVNPEDVELFLDEHAVIGIWGDGQTPGGLAAWLILEGRGSISGGVNLYPGSLASIYTYVPGSGDGFEDLLPWFEMMGYVNIKGISYVEFFHGALFPPLEGVLVDQIDFRCDGAGDVRLTLAWLELSGVYDTQIIHQPDDRLVAHWAFDEDGGNIAEDSARNNDGVIYGAEWTGGVIDGALDFDGIDDYVDCGGDNDLNLGTENFSISAWIKPRSLGIDEARGIVSKWQDSDNRWLLYTYEEKIAFASKAGGDWAYAVLSENILEVERWYHVCFVADYNESPLGDDAIIYVDGEDRTDFCSKLYSCPSLDNSAAVKIGFNGSTETPACFDGVIDDVRIYKMSLTSETIQWILSQDSISIHYVDAANGNDDNNGFTTNAAFRTIQKGINAAQWKRGDAARQDETVIVAPGTYTGPGNKNLVFRGETETTVCVRSTAGPHKTVIDCEGSGRAFFFDSYWPKIVIDGFTMTGGRVSKGGAIYVDTGAYAPTIMNCIIRDNYATIRGGAVFCGHTWGSLRMINSLLEGNAAGDQGGAMFYTRSSFGLYNCTITGNQAPRANVIWSYHSATRMRNTILWDNGSDVHNQIVNINEYMNYEYFIKLAHCCIEGGIGLIEGGTSDEGNNIDADPLFADPNTGDYHLKSQGGRWDAGNAVWVVAEVTSPCIDAGDPKEPIMHEPFPNGGRINMGAYGGTVEASKSYFGKPPCKTIVAGDVNGDCVVDFKDFALMALHWLDDG